MIKIDVIREEVFTEIELRDSVKGTGPMQAILRGVGKALDESNAPLPDRLKFQFEDVEFSLMTSEPYNHLADYDEQALQEELRRRAEQMDNPAIEDIWNDQR